jgi:hypothetical protein
VGTIVAGLNFSEPVPSSFSGIEINANKTALQDIVTIAINKRKLLSPTTIIGCAARWA